MRNHIKILICLFFGIFLTGCGKAAPAPTATTSAEIAAIQTIAVATARAQMTGTAVRSPTPTLTPNMFLTRIAKITPPAIALVTFEPTKLPAILQNALSVQTMEAFNGHSLQRITGWQYGFNGFKWMDENHLLIRPIVGAEHTGPVDYRFAGLPVVMQLNNNTMWFPPSGYGTANGVYFDSSLSGVSMAYERTFSGDTIHTYSLEGDLLKTYQGRLLGISPSGSKILLAGSAADPNGTEIKWLDLLNNKEVMFDWQKLPKSYETPLIWSPDEMSVYAITYFGSFYGSVKTGESYAVSYDRPMDGEDSDHLIAAPRHSYGTWVLNDTYLLARWNEYYEGTPGYLSFFDLKKKAYRNLSALAGLPYLSEVGVNPDPPYPCENGEPLATPGGRYVWVSCQDGGHLIDMKTFKAKTYPYYPEATLDWSADGNFAFLRYSDGDPDPQILSAASNQLTPIPTKARCSAWHPKQNVFVYLSDDRHTLAIFDTRSMSPGRTIDLPIAFACPVWNASGNKLMMIRDDDTLWQIDYPALSHLEQLTSPIQGIKDLALSPDGTSIALVAGPDIYIVDTSRKP